MLSWTPSRHPGRQRAARALVVLGLLGGVAVPSGSAAAVPTTSTKATTTATTRSALPVKVDSRPGVVDLRAPRPVKRVAAASAPAPAPTPEKVLLDLVNAERRLAGVPPLTWASDVAAVAETWSGKMASTKVLGHNPDYSQQITGWTMLAENVGYAGDLAGVHRALMQSSQHRANILDARYTQVGLGVVSSGGRTWVTQNFRRP